MKQNKSLRKRLVQMLVKNIDTFTNQKGKWSLIQVEKKYYYLITNFIC